MIFFKKKKPEVKEEMPLPELPEEAPSVPLAAPPPAQPSEMPSPPPVPIKERLEIKVPEVEIKAHPPFIPASEYSKILENANLIRARLLESEQFIVKINGIRTEVDKILDQWKASLESIEKKLTYVDSIISKAEAMV